MQFQLLSTLFATAMCSFFSGEKFDLKIDEFVKKFEDRLADIEDKEVLKTKFYETDLSIV